MAREEHIRALGAVLVSGGLFSQQDLQDAISAQRSSGKSFTSILLDMNLCSQEDLLKHLSDYLGFDIVELDSMSIDEEALKKVSPDTAHSLGVLPLSYSDDILKVVLVDPFNMSAVDELRFMLGINVVGALASEKSVLEKMQAVYGADEPLKEAVQDVDANINLDEAAMSLVNATGEADKLSELADQAPVVDLLNRVILQAVERRASDIHFEPFDKTYKIRYRIDGACYEIASPSKALSVAIASRIKVLANMDVAESRLPQDGRIMMSVEKRDIDLRVSTLPTVFGESIVMRILDKSVVSLSLDQIGMYEDLKETIRSCIRRPNGIFLLTGPTGSGKTTTLYSCLKEVSSSDVKVITTEDPVEYDIGGIIQVPIQPKIDLTFARCLRSILRQDPDIIMVGEIRDTETARIAVQAALTGHLVFSTLHTNDAPGTVTRLMDMDIEPFLISSTIQAVLAQRLVRVICPQCKEESVPDAEEVEMLGLEIGGANKFYHGKGCEHCNGSGYKGRSGIFELFVIDEDIKEMIVKKAQASEIKKLAVEKGMKTLKAYGIEKVLDGTTTISEVLKVTQSYL